MKTARIGSISHGTLRTEDLLSTFISELEGLVLINGDYFSLPENRQHRDRLNGLIGEAGSLLSDEGEVSEEQNEDYVSQTIADLEDALSEFAPPYCYFGSHPGDGSDFGFWPCMEAINELPVVADSDEARALGEDCKSVNDHGNVTVYGADGSILLELV